jgi:hypothetical protein
MPNGSEKISAVVPVELRDHLERSARANDRSLSAELRRALTAYLSGSTGKSRGRNQRVTDSTQPRRLP